MHTRVPVSTEAPEATRMEPPLILSAQPDAGSRNPQNEERKRNIRRAGEHIPEQEVGQSRRYESDGKYDRCPPEPQRVIGR